MPSGGPRINSGRKRGSKNKTTIEREDKARLAIEQAAEMRRALVAGASPAELMERARNRKLAKEILEDLLSLFAGLTAKHQPLELAEGQRPPEGREPNAVLFDKFSAVTIDIGKALLPFQSARLSAVMIAPAAPTVVEGERKKRFTLTVFEGGKVIDAEAVNE